MGVCVNLCAPVYEGAYRGQVEGFNASGSSIILDQVLPNVGGWEPIPGPLEKQQVLLTAKASPQPWYALHSIQCNWVLTILGTTHSTGVTAGRALQLRYFLQGYFRGPECWLPTLLSSYTLWIQNVNALYTSAS